MPTVFVIRIFSSLTVVSLLCPRCSTTQNCDEPYLSCDFDCFLIHKVNYPDLHMGVGKSAELEDIGDGYKPEESHGIP